MGMTSHRRILAALAVTALALAGCGSNGENSASEADTRSGGTVGGGCGSGDLSGSLTVFAAASLKASFDTIRDEFGADHPCVTVADITYDGSSTLAKQIQDGAPADVFASANETNMDKVAGLVTDRTDFATNSLQIAVAPGNPLHLESLADLARDDVVTVLCAPEVPCGDASHTAFDAAGVTVTPASEEQNVKAVLTKVSTGNADAGLVYHTDVTSSDGAVDGVDFPEAAEAVNTYPIATLTGSDNSAAATAFVDFVTGARGQAVLAGVGFGAP